MITCDEIPLQKSIQMSFVLHILKIDLNSERQVRNKYLFNKGIKITPSITVLHFQTPTRCVLTQNIYLS